MKTFINKTFLAVVATVLVAGTAFFTSCEKEEKEMVQSLSPKSISMEAIPEYETMEEVLAIIETASSFDTVTELLEYENLQGRNSIGAISDAFYEGIEIDNFSSEDEIQNFYFENSHLLDTFVENNEVFLYPKWTNHSFRYVANQDGLFSINGYVYRLFKNAIVSTDENNLTKLLNLTERNLISLDTNIFKKSQMIRTYVSHSTCKDDDDTYGASKTNGRSRFSLELRLECIRTLISTYDVRTTLWAANHTKSRTFDWWITARHSVTIDGSVTLHKKLANGTWVEVTKYINKNKRINSKTFEIYNDSNLNPECQFLSNYHFKSFNIKGRNPSTDYVILN